MNPFEGYRITSPWGPRKHPVTGIPHFHTGIDLVKSHKAPIPAFVGGQVVHAGEGRAGTGFGNMGIVVAVRDKYDSLHCYVHLDSVSVSVGEIVKQGQEIGKQGNTGKFSTASHLHYEIRKKSSPSYGWIEAEEPRCYEPTQYLIDYYTREEEEAMYKELLEKVNKMQNSIDALMKQSEKVEPPAWFVKEFGEVANIKFYDKPLINDPQMTNESWRQLAFSLRAIGFKKPFYPNHFS